MALNAEEFNRRSEDFFAASYLTSLGVIQSVALGFLATTMFGVMESDISSVWLRYVIIGQALGSFLAIVLIVEEYHWWLIIVRRTPTYLDAIIPYVLGASELAAIGFVGNTSGAWLLAMSVLAIFGILSLFNSRSYCVPNLFRECPWLLPRARRNLEAGIIMVIFMVIDLVVAFIFWQHLSFWARASSIILLYILMIVMIAASSRFLQSVQQNFEQISTNIPHQ